MKPIKLPICSHPDCSNFATVVKGKNHDFCLLHLTEAKRDQINKDFNGSTSLQNSTLDGRDPDGKLFHCSPFRIKKGSDCKGSLFIAVDFSSADIEQADLSFCQFVYCDLRRAKLFNTSLRWTRFNRSLLRQTDINNSDCRWMQAQSTHNTKVGDLTKTLRTLWNKLNSAPSNYLHLVGNDDGDFFFRRFSFEPEGSDKELFRAQKYNRLTTVASSSNTPWNTALENITSPGHHRISQTDWSGSALRDCDLAYACFDGALAHEVSFDGSDLHEASFNGADLQRSSFINASFSRSNPVNHDDGKKPARHVVYTDSRFQNANLDGCVLNGTNLCGMFFEGTAFSNASLEGALLNRSIFFACEMENISADDVIGPQSCFFASDLSGASLKGAILRNSAFHWNDKTALPIDLEASIIERLKQAWVDKDPAEGKDRSILTGANFQAVELDGSDLTRCFAAGVLFQGAGLKNAKFTNAICTGSQFLASIVDGTDFTGANLTSCDFSDAGIEEEPPIFSNTILVDAIFKNMSLESVQVVDGNLESVDFSSCRLSGAKFTSTKPIGLLNVQRATFRNSDLSGAKFENVDLSSADLSFCTGNLVLAHKSEGILFRNCLINSATFRGTMLNYYHWQSCDFSKSDISDSTLRKGKIEYCVLADTSFRGSEFHGVGIEHAFDLTGADFSNASFFKFGKSKCLISGIPKDAPQGSPLLDHFPPSELSIEECVSHPRDFAAVNFDSISSQGLELAHIRFESSSFEYANLDLANCKETIFSNSNFPYSLCKITKSDGIHFSYCDFSNANIKNLTVCDYLNIKKSIFLGCNFDECALPRSPKYLLFIDCNFRLSSFWADTNSVRKWGKPLFIHCRFSDLKYHGLQDVADEQGLEIEQSMTTFGQLIDEIRSNFKDRGKAIEWARNQELGGSTTKDRLKSLLPKDDSREGYDLIIPFCRELRKDLFEQGLSEVASTAYVNEMDYNLKLKAITYQTKNSIAQSINPFSLFDRLLSAVINFAGLQTKSLHVGMGMLFMLAVFSYLSHTLIAGCLIIPPLVVILSIGSTIGRSLVAKHLYSYGEDFVKICSSSLACIVAFTFVYMSFVPNLDHEKSSGQYDHLNYSQQISLPLMDSVMAVNTLSALSITERTQALEPLPTLVAIGLPGNDTKSGYLSVDGQPVAMDGSFKGAVEAFLTCFYFSVITFTTLGYSDITPAGLVRFAAMIEAGAGAFLIALFVFTFTRRNALR